MGAVKNWLNIQAEHISAFPLAPATISEIISSIDKGIINYSQAEQKLFPAILSNPEMSVAQLIEELNLAQSGDDDFLLTLINEVLTENSAKVAEYKSGKKGLLGMFMGEIMKKSKGKADPKKTSALLSKALNK
jgi:aspartyl-tRNA(Asn)/glutamyl-tRNA(Gln) amidotransferase subunit B